MATRSRIDDPTHATAKSATAASKRRNAQNAVVAAIASDARAAWKKARRAASQIDLERRARFSRIEPL